MSLSINTEYIFIITKILLKITMWVVNAMLSDLLEYGLIDWFVHGLVGCLVVVSGVCDGCLVGIYPGCLVV